MKRYLAMAFLLILAACAGQTTDTEPQQTFSCPDGTVVTNLSDCPEPEQAPQEPETDDVVAEPEEEDSQGPGLLDAKFNREAFNEVFTSDETATPPVGSSLRDIQQRALAKTLDGYSYTYFLRDAKYLRLKSARIMYTLPARWLRNLGGMGQLQAYLTGRNLLTWTPLTVLDPEIRNDAGHSYPLERAYTIGIQMGF